MIKATIETDKQSLRYVEAADTHHVGWESLSIVTASGVKPSLFDEVALVFSAGQRKIYVLETDPGFEALCRALKLDEYLPGDWYQQAESGQSLTVDLRKQT